MDGCWAGQFNHRLATAGRFFPIGLILFGALILPVADACAQPSGQPGAASVNILYVRETVDRPPPLSLLDLPPKDVGLAGATLAIADNNNTGRFIGQEYRLDVIEDGSADELVRQASEWVDKGGHFLVLAVEPQTAVKLADALEGKEALLFNAGASDDNLREENCRANVLHTAPSRAMLTDALAQYLVWKQWRRWFLIVGERPEDQAYGEALRRSAKRFGARIVEERTFAETGGSRRADGGHEQVQQQMPLFTQNAAEHDVVVVADESELFGEYLPYRTWDARPVVGTQGLTPMSWHPALEQWGGTQFQNRFQRSANRTMRPLDYDVWVAVRAIGEGATRRNSTDYGEIAAHLRTPDFAVAGFKGQKLTFREWNGQLRQPILVATPKLVVSVSPQPGFLHEFSELDTLGVDRPETKCKL